MDLMLAVRRKLAEAVRPGRFQTRLVTCPKVRSRDNPGMATCFTGNRLTLLVRQGRFVGSAGRECCGDASGCDDETGSHGVSLFWCFAALIGCKAPSPLLRAHIWSNFFESLTPSRIYA